MHFLKILSTKLVVFLGVFGKKCEISVSGAFLKKHKSVRVTA